MPEPRFELCRVGRLPVREEAKSSSQMVSELLYGEGFYILESREDHWHKIRMEWDHYEGWISYRSIPAVADPLEVIEYEQGRPRYLMHPLTLVGGSFQQPVMIGFGSRIDQLCSEIPGFHVGEIQLKALMQNYLGSPYLWGGRSVFGIDCSGFTQQIMKFLGVKLLRDASQQAKQGMAIESLRDAHFGDLLFFSKQDKVTHVGIYLQNNEIVHATDIVRIDAVTEEGVWNNYLGHYTLTLHSIRRFKI